MIIDLLVKIKGKKTALVSVVLFLFVSAIDGLTGWLNTTDGFGGSTQVCAACIDLNQNANHRSDLGRSKSYCD
jgi:hypothetical protein